MKKIKMYRCELCRKNYESKKECEQCEQNHAKIDNITAIRYFPRYQDKNGVPYELKISYANKGAYRYIRTNG